MHFVPRRAPIILMAEGDNGETFGASCGLDEREFHEAFSIFSNNGETVSTVHSVLLPFLKSLGIRDEAVTEAVLREAKNHSSFISEASLMQLLRKHIPGLDSYWPSHHDAVQAFRVFDSEGVGFIKVTLLKRFLGQAQLNADDASLEKLIRENCQIDGDDLINYQDFVQNIHKKFLECSMESS